MKRVYISQRVDVIESYGERRDALDQQWAAFLWACGLLACPLPGCPEAVKALLEASPPDGILLSGGNSPVSYGGSAPERDEVDSLLAVYAERTRTPLVGVCRGMQSILLHFGGELREVEGHAAVRHQVEGSISREVNSYHTLAAKAVPPALEELAKTSDGVVEAVRHRMLPILGMMWHPEREVSYRQEDFDLFSELYEGGKTL